VLSAAPDLILSATPGRSGQMRFTAMGSLTKCTGADGSMFAYAAAPIAGYDYDLSHALHAGLQAGAVNADDTVAETIDGKEGFTFKPGYKLDPIRSTRTA
jgi:hypothetical protein